MRDTRSGIQEVRRLLQGNNDFPKYSKNCDFQMVFIKIFENSIKAFKSTSHEKDTMTVALSKTSFKIILIHNISYAHYSNYE